MAARDATQGRRKATGNALNGESCLHPRVEWCDTRRPSLHHGGKAEARATTAAGDAKALGRRFAGYGAGGGRGDAGSVARGGWARRGGKRQWRCGPTSVRRVILSIFFVFLGGGGDGWCRRHSSTMVTRHYVFGFSNVHSTTVHCCLVCCVDGSEGRWKEVHGVWWGEAASAKPMGGKTI